MKALVMGALGVMVGLVLATSWGTPTAGAKTPEEVEAAKIYQRASQAVANKEYRKAAQLFERAYNYDPDPQLLMMAANAHEADLDPAQARVRYWNVVNHPKATPGQKKAARDHMIRLATKLRRAGKHVKELPVSGVPATKKSTTTTTNPSGTATTTTTKVRVVGSTGGGATTRTTTTTTPATTRPATTRPATGGKGQVRSGNIVRVARPDVDEAYMLSAMHCRWDGPTGRFMQCSSSHAWGGAANFDISRSRAQAAGNGLTIGFQNTYKGKPYCSVEFQDIAALRRVTPAPSGVTIWLHNGAGAPKNWSEVRTWITVVCHGVD